MPCLEQYLIIDRCPHCNIDNPNLEQYYRFDTTAHNNSNKRHWGIYVCKRCGGVVSASAFADGKSYLWVNQIYPSPISIDENLPDRAKAYLEQAVNSLHAPSGAIMLAASSIDSMLKYKGYTSGSLYGRIDKAAKDHLITQDMAVWAHEVRLEANGQRHADEEEELPTTGDAQKVIDFTMALAQFLYVLPSRVERGIKQAKGVNEQAPSPQTTT